MEVGSPAGMEDDSPPTVDVENSIVLDAGKLLIFEPVGTPEGMSDRVEVDIGTIVSDWPVDVFSASTVEVGTPLWDPF